jgi:hypothetical protein
LLEDVSPSEMPIEALPAIPPLDLQARYERVEELKAEVPTPTTSGSAAPVVGPPSTEDAGLAPPEAPETAGEEAPAGAAVPAVEAELATVHFEEKGRAVEDNDGTVEPDEDDDAEREDELPRRINPAAVPLTVLKDDEGHVLFNVYTKTEVARRTMEAESSDSQHSTVSTAPSTRSQRRQHGRKKEDKNRSSDKDEKPKYAWDTVNDPYGKRMPEIRMNERRGMSSAMVDATVTTPDMLRDRARALLAAGELQEMVEARREHHAAARIFAERLGATKVVSPYIDLDWPGVTCVHVPVDEFGRYELRSEDEDAQLAIDLVSPAIQDNYCTLAHSFTFVRADAVYRRVGTPTKPGEPRTYQWGYRSKSGTAVYWKDHVLLADPTVGSCDVAGVQYARYAEVFDQTGHAFRLVETDAPAPRHAEETCAFVACDSGDAWVPTALLAKLNPDRAVVALADEQSMKVNALRWLEKKAPWLQADAHERIALAAVKHSIIDATGQDNVSVAADRAAEHYARQFANAHGKAWQGPVEVAIGLGQAAVSNLAIRILLMLGALVWTESIDRSSGHYAAAGAALWLVGFYLLLFAPYPATPSFLRDRLRRTGGQLVEVDWVNRRLTVFYTSTMMRIATRRFGPYVTDREDMYMRALNFLWARGNTWLWFLWYRTDVPCQGIFSHLCSGTDMDAFEFMKLLAAVLACELITPLANGAIAVLTADAAMVWSAVVMVSKEGAGLVLRMISALRQSVSPQ